MWLSMQAMLAVHFLRNATVTVLLSQRRVSPASETKLGKAPKDVEYVGEGTLLLPCLDVDKLSCPCPLLEQSPPCTLA